MFTAAIADVRARGLAIFAALFVVTTFVPTAVAGATGSGHDDKARCARHHGHLKAGHTHHGHGRGHKKHDGDCGAGGSAQGRIVIVKRTNPHGTGTAFGFTAAALDADGFSLKDGESATFDKLTPGTFTVGENATAGWTLKAVHCHDATDNTTVSGSTATINVAAGETVVCVFKNVQPPPAGGKGKIVITKRTHPDNSVQAFTFSAPGLDADGFALKDDESVTFDNLTPGTFTVSENATAGWTLKRIFCSSTSEDHKSSKDEDHKPPKGDDDAPWKGDDDRSWKAHASWADQWGGGGDDSDARVTVNGNAVTINVAAGETVSCVFKNKQVPPGAPLGTIVVAKATVPAGANASFAFTAPALDADGFALSHGQSVTFSGLAPGTYTVTESSLAGWTLQTIACVDPSSDTTAAAAAATIKVAAGETVTCTFTNAAVQATAAPTTPAQPTTPTSGVLSETQSSVSPRAALTAPQQCVKATYNVRIRGRAITRVSFSVNGRHVKTVRATSPTLVRTTLKMRSGRVQHLVVRVTFTANARPRSKTLRATVLRCQPVRGVLPSFTG